MSAIIAWMDRAGWPWLVVLLALVATANDVADALVALLGMALEVLL